MQETWVWSLIQEDPTCHEQLSPCATPMKPVLQSPRASTTEPTCPRTCSNTREAATVRSPLTTTREKPTQQWRSSTASNKQTNKTETMPGRLLWRATTAWLRTLPGSVVLQPGFPRSPSCPGQSTDALKHSQKPFPKPSSGSHFRNDGDF